MNYRPLKLKLKSLHKITSPKERIFHILQTTNTISVSVSVCGPEPELHGEHEEARGDRRLDNGQLVSVTI